MRKHLRLSVLALAAMFAGGAYAQHYNDLGLTDEDNLLKDIKTPESAHDHLWVFGWDDEPELDEAAEDNGLNSQEEKDRMYKLVDGNSGTYVSSDWSRASNDNTFRQFLDVYLDSPVKGPMIAWILRADKGNSHVEEMDIWASDGSATKYGMIAGGDGWDDSKIRHEGTADFRGWEFVAHVSVTNPTALADGLTDLFTLEKPYKYLRFEWKKCADKPNRPNSSHMAEFKLFNLSEEQAAPMQLKSDYARYAEYLEKKPETFMGTDYYQYTDWDSYNSFMEDLKNVNDFVNNGKELRNEQALALHNSVNANYQKLMESQVLFNIEEPGYYRIEFVKKPGFCISSNSLYNAAFVSKDDANDARQLWYMEPLEGGKTSCVNAADGSFSAGRPGNPGHTYFFTTQELIKYAHAQNNTPVSRAIFFDYLNAGNDEAGRPIVGFRMDGSNWVLSGADGDGYISSNQATAVGNTENAYLANIGKWNDEASQVVLVRVPDAEAEKAIAESPYRFYTQLQEKIEEANDLLDIAADAENCFSNDFKGELLKDMGAISAGGDDNSAKGTHKIEVDLGSKVDGGVNVFMSYAKPGNGGNPIEWRVYGSNDNANWTLLDPCYNGEFHNNEECGTLPLNLGKGYQYLRFVCWLSWSKDGYFYSRNTIDLSAFRIYRAERKSTAQIENEASQALLAAVQAAIDVAADKAAQADIDALQAAINQYKLGFADPTALRQLLAQTQFLAAGASDEFVGENAGLFIEAMDAEFSASWDEANTYANNGVYSQDGLEKYFNILTSLKADVENAAIMPDASIYYNLYFASEYLYDDYNWSKAKCWDNGVSLFDKALSAESAEEGAKFLYSDQLDESDDLLSNFRFEQNGDTYAIVNGCGKYLSLVNGLPRLSETPTYYSVIPVGFGLFIFKAEGVVLNGEVSNLTLDTAADGNCNTNAAFLLEDSGFTYDAISNIKDNKQKSNAIYSIDGKQVNDNFKGVVIKNGNKFLNK